MSLFKCALRSHKNIISIIPLTRTNSYMDWKNKIRSKNEENLNRWSIDLATFGCILLGVLPY